MAPEFGMSGKKPPLGSGMVNQAAGTMLGRPYQMHVEEAKSLGQKPLTPQEFQAQQRGG